MREAQHRNRSGLRTDGEADAAARAACARIGGGAVSVDVEFIGEADGFGWAGFDAEAASFAFVPVDSQVSAISSLGFGHLVLLPGGRRL
jgi:hypothetical protein